MQPRVPLNPAPRAPRFYITGRQPLRPEVIVLAIALAVGALWAILIAMGHTRSLHPRPDSFGSSGAARGAASASGDDDKDDDPSRIDTIVLGDPSEAPVPGRVGNHFSPVHPTIVIVLPRSGSQVGLIPDGAAGRLLYAWLAAFNQANALQLASILPSNSALPGVTAAAQIQLRRQTGGFNLVSAKEVQPGILVFRLRDQTPQGIEALGTLQVRPDSIPASIMSFSLGAVPSPQPSPPR